MLPNAIKTNANIIENMFLKSEHIIECCARGIPNDATACDDIHVFVRLHKNAQKGQIDQFINDSIPSIYPIRLHQTSDPLPLLINGKIDGERLLSTLA